MKEVPLACQTCGTHVGVAQDFKEFLDQLDYYSVTGVVECLKCANMRYKISRRNNHGKNLGMEPVRYG